MRSPALPLTFGLALVVACGDEGDAGKASGSANTSDSTSSDGSATDNSASNTTDPSTTQTTQATDGPTSTSTSGDDGSFVQEPDMGSSNQCDPKAQDCPDGEKCTAWANDGGTFWNENKCVPVTGEGVSGDQCMIEGNGVSGLDDCAKGFICLNTDEMGLGQCIRFCQGNDEDCDPGYICAIYNDGVLPICLDECHPLSQDCPPNQACIDTPNGNFICFNDASGTGGAAGDPCPVEHGENSCDPGLWCGAGSSGCNNTKCCTPYCDVTGPDNCSSPNQCVSFYSDPGAAPPQYADVGVCVLP